METFYLQNSLWHKNFYDYLHQTSTGYTVQKVTEVTITQSTNYGVLPAFKSNKTRTSLGGAVVKNPPANAGDTDLIPGPGRSHMQRNNRARAPQLPSLCSRAC